MTFVPRMSEFVYVAVVLSVDLPCSWFGVEVVFADQLELVLLLLLYPVKTGTAVPPL